jgi:hypothetical protein
MTKPNPSKAEFVGLDALEAQADPSELALDSASDPVADEPGDDAILVQEELYDGISSDQLPSSKLEKE